MCVSAFERAPVVARSTAPCRTSTPSATRTTSTPSRQSRCSTSPHKLTNITTAIARPRPSSSSRRRPWTGCVRSSMIAAGRLTACAQNTAAGVATGAARTAPMAAGARQLSGLDDVCVAFAHTCLSGSGVEIYLCPAQKTTVGKGGHGADVRRVWDQEVREGNENARQQCAGACARARARARAHLCTASSTPRSLQLAATGEGCYISGSVEVNRVPGNLVFSVHSEGHSFDKVLSVLLVGTALAQRRA